MNLWDCNTGGGLAPEVTISTTQSEEKRFWLLKVSLRQRLKREEALGAAGRDSPASTCTACEQSYHSVSLRHTHEWSSLATSVEQVEDRSSRFLLIIIITINLTNHLITGTRSLRRTLLPKPRLMVPTAPVVRAWGKWLYTVYNIKSFVWRWSIVLLFLVLFSVFTFKNCAAVVSSLYFCFPQTL